MFSQLDPAMPALVAQDLKLHWQRFTERCPEQGEWLQALFSDADLQQQLAKTWACSQFAVEACLRETTAFRQQLEQGVFQRSYQPGEMAQRLRERLANVSTREALDAQLRHFRRSEQLRIIWRDLNRLADMRETTRDVSDLAEATINQALDFHHQALVAVHGRPMGTIKGQLCEQRMLVIGMGKLGARELNLSSDIDLIFAYPRSGHTDGDKCIDNHQFFLRLGQRLIQSLDAPTAEGFVFRVDMRLRPYGQSGALALSFDALEEYYQDQGRDWERYAMIKARVIAGEPARAEELINLLRPFSYRRYVDFSAIESLRDMKKLIRQEVKRRRLGNDVKLGPGGIREVEFIVQSFQLIRGGRETELQERSLLKVLDILADQQYLPVAVVDELREAYTFLRNAEHVIQAWQDRQTQALPEDRYPQAVMAYAMGFESWEAFSTELGKHRDNVSRHFAALVADDDEAEEAAVDTCWRTVWLGEDEAECLETLSEAGHEDAADVQRRLQALRESPVVTRMQAVARERLDAFMPRLLQAIAEADQPSQAMVRVVPLVEAILRRTAYMVLLVENPAALTELVTLCSASPLISTQLARHPVLLDELLNARTLYSTPDQVELRSDLKQQVLRLPLDDLEAHMDTLRYFRLAHVLKVAACEVSERLPVMKVSDYLTWIAEAILEHVLNLAWHNLVERHGCPVRADGSPCNKDFIVVGYGKLGGIELGHGSDLDLVFIHDAPVGMATTGERAVDNGTFFTRLGQRMIHILTAHTSMGTLYEVDMRLRPSGNSGLLVSSLEAFRQYQEKDAWTWEHQALVRARVVAGDGELAQKFEALRHELLAKPRDEATLKHDVVEMRAKMRSAMLPPPTKADESTLFPVKQGVGGIVDIEFMVQYAVLAWSQNHPALTTFTDNIRILETLQAEGLFSEPEALALMEAYKAYRASAHRLSLQEQKVEVPQADVAQHREVVQQKWQALLG